MMNRANHWHPPTLMITLGLVLGLALSNSACSDDDSSDLCVDVAHPCEIPGGASCDGNVIQTCEENADGCLVWVDTNMCPASLACFGGSCICDDECVPDDNQCSGNTIAHCTETIEGCLFWASGQNCAVTDMSCDDTEDATCVEGAGCGNDMMELPEVCDGSDLGGEDCVTQGFGVGALACNEFCTGFDTGACTPSVSCGNEIIETPEVCDGSELGGEGCESQGFHSGELACRANCGAFDTGGCDGFCGDGGVNGPEDCDMNDLGGFSCETLGFYDGVLTCDASCLRDASACVGSCGDDVLNGPESCDGTDVGLMTCQDFGYPGGVLGCSQSCDAFDVRLCVSPWTVGDCWISEPVPSISAAEFSLVNVSGRVFISGLTDLSSGPDSDPLVRADVGVGPDGSNPSQSSAGWHWYPAVPNAGYTDATNDEYEGDLILPAASGSPYDYAYRFSADAGQSWTYCDLIDSIYSPANAGHLEVSP